MPNPVATDDHTITSIRNILDNYDYVANWITAVVVAGIFASLVGLSDKLVAGALAFSFFTSVMLAVVLWPIMLVEGYGSFLYSIMFGIVIGSAGVLILLTLVGLIRTRVKKRMESLADKIDPNQEKKA